MCAQQNALMESKGVPKALRERVRRYYDEIWARRQPYSEDEILNSMHSALRRDILRAMYSVSVAPTNPLHA